MPESDKQIIQSILKEIENLNTIMRDKTQNDLEEDLTLERAVCMTLGIIGEKTSKVYDLRGKKIAKGWVRAVTIFIAAFSL
ncbi:hypothetical protein SAMN05444410_10924 [Hydrobacter penzbergensis]|uniref:Uncharacterized protein n=1 Tax=Hydrobacter penzbergensis TaxID=1235997 RepID=A0A8X8IG46_9BACT|nr:hypothetical protein [Hydrobacter penzbergensis]SDX09584.1 hypothetical protein SAMN05444410_10924 [Hydrobacter penzbergensis]